VAIAAMMLLPVGLLGGAVFAVTLALFMTGLVARIGMRASLWLPIASAIFLVAWPIGFFKELLFPLHDATGK
jgi:hypothetical protein